ncbi:MAG: response regulator [Elusimicrobia bacterium]|nr:response regulator [Elusimicrobiota bacterium]
MAKILIVDDEPDFRLLLKHILGKAGHEVAEAAGAPEALGMLAKVKPDLAVVDWNMPVMSGLEFCRTIRQQKDFGHLPIVMLTVRQQDADHLEGIHHGADLYLTKPIDPQELLMRLAALLKNK